MDPKLHIVSFVPSYTGVYTIWVAVFTDYGHASHLTVYNANDPGSVLVGDDGWYHAALTAGVRYYIVFWSAVEYPSASGTYLTAEFLQETEFTVHERPKIFQAELSYFSSAGYLDVYLNFEAGDMWKISYFNPANYLIEFYDPQGFCWGSGDMNCADLNTGRHFIRIYAPLNGYVMITVAPYRP